MTGPAHGKLLLDGARIFVDGREVEGEVYVHVCGYALARVTHLDKESEELNEIYPSRSGSPSLSTASTAG